jgi:PAS domain S-box-containing protein
MKKKILVVDNHPLILKFMSSLLEKEGHEVLTAKDGLSALNILKTCIPQVIFIDLIMPNIDGKKLCQIIRAIPKLRDAYLIILSAIAAEEGYDFAEFGANACIAKGPFDKMRQYVLRALGQSDQETPGGLAGEIIGVEGVQGREITRELLSVKRHFEVILESMTEGILGITPEARIVCANPAAIALSDMPEEKLLGSNFIELFCETGRQRIEEALEAMDTKSQTITEEFPVKLNGKQIALNLLPIDSEEHMTVVILNDVTEKKRLEVQLQQARKMEAVGTLAGGIAHNFNNLLMGIQGNCALMLSSIDTTHPHYENLKNIEKQVKSGAKLTAQLLGYSRKGRYEVKAINFNRLVEDTMDTFGETKKEITIHRHLAEDLFAIEADEGQIEQVLLNLFVNAGHAMPGGGDLILKTMNVTHDDMRGKVYNPKPGDYVLLTVSDTGTGMDKKTTERIFDPFFTTKEIGQGTGLGLASTYGIVKGHSGYIDVVSEKGHGTSFGIYLPASQRKVEETANSSEPITEGSGTILLVDDNPLMLDVGVKMLNSLGYTTLEAKGGREAVEVYRENKDRIDMVILDMIMPDMGGGKTYERIKEINPHIKVILSSGYRIDSEAARILKQGCDGFIQKPFSLKELSTKIEERLEKR